MAAPTLVGTPTTNEALASSISVTAPTGTAAGDHQLVFLCVYSRTETVTTPSGWSLIGTQDNTTSSVQFRIHVFRSTTVTGSQSFTKSGAAASYITRMTYRGGDGYESFVGDGGSGSSVNHPLGTATTTVADSVVVGVLCEGTSTGSAAFSHSMTSPWTEQFDWSTSTAIGRRGMMAGYDTVKATPGTQGGTIVSSTAGHGATVAVVLAGTTSTPTTIGPVTDSGTGSDTAAVDVVTVKSATDSGTGSDTASVVDIPAPPTPGQLFDLSRWHLTLPTEDPGPDTDAAQINQPELATYTDQNYYVENGMIVCRAPVQGATTSGASGATRAEHREHEANYANSAWDPLTTGRRQLTITSHLDATNITGGSTPRKEMIWAQIHGAGDSPIPFVLAAEYHVATPRVRVFLNGPGFANPVTGITPTTPVTARIRVEDARLKLWIVAGQVADLPASPTYDWDIASTFTDLEGWYFKWGAYNKTTITSGSSGESYARISYYDLLQPGDPDPVTAPRRLFLPF